MTKQIDIYFDGACHNQRGVMKPMGAGVAVFVNGQYHETLSCAQYVDKGTSNIAEYKALLLALTTLLSMVKSGEWDGYVYSIFSDSQLITNQYNGDWAINHNHLRWYCEGAKEIARIAGWTGRIKWIRREKNTKADELSKQGLAKAPNTH